MPAEPTVSSERESRRLVEQFFLALELHDQASLPPLLAPHVAEVIPFSATGDPKPFAEFDGKEAVLGYLGLILSRFSRTVLTDKSFHVADRGRVVFVEANGDLVQAGTHVPYRNVYVFKFVIEDGQIARITEYANPVTFAKLMGIPLG